MLTIDIDRQIAIPAGDSDIPDDQTLTRWMQSAYLGNDRAEAAVLIVDEIESHRLNLNYRQQDKPTNVLSFAANLEPVDGIRHLGDIVICAPIVVREAAQQAKSCAAHWAHMAIHGMLHLQDYDHIEVRDAEIMEAREIEILARLGFDNPYHIIEPDPGDAIAGNGH